MSIKEILESLDLEEASPSVTNSLKERRANREGRGADDFIIQQRKKLDEMTPDRAKIRRRVLIQHWRDMGYVGQGEYSSIEEIIASECPMCHHDPCTCDESKGDHKISEFEHHCAANHHGKKKESHGDEDNKDFHRRLEHYHTMKSLGKSPREHITKSDHKKAAGLHSLAADKEFSRNQFEKAGFHHNLAHHHNSISK